MPTFGQWAKFLSACTLLLGGGALFTKYGPPTDEEFMKKLSPEARAQALKYQDLRQRTSRIIGERIKENPDKPAWLQGSRLMREFEQQCVEQARAEIENEQRAQALAAERERLKVLATNEL